jgi:protein-tyrosine phosphatase
MENIINFRDLGGIPVSGGVVKSGIFFRSAEMDFASESDIEYIKSLNIRAIFDFRDESEKLNLKIYEKIGIPYCNIPVRAENAKIVRLRIKPDFKTFMSLNQSDVRGVYAELPFENPSYKKLFALIKDGETPILFHCTAGKDRTGVAAGLLLALLGAEKSEIVRDYMRTREAVPKLKEKVLRNINFLLRGFVGRKMQPLFDVDESYIMSAFSAVFEKYGSIEEYFKIEYGYTDDDIAELRGNSTEIKV